MDRSTLVGSGPWAGVACEREEAHIVPSKDVLNGAALVPLRNHPYVINQSTIKKFHKYLYKNN
jgi:hypothetical protein